MSYQHNMSEQAFINGFIKRAAEYNIPQAQALGLLKESAMPLQQGGAMGGMGGGAQSLASPNYLKMFRQQNGGGFNTNSAMDRGKMSQITGFNVQPHSPGASQPTDMTNPSGGGIPNYLAMFRRQNGGQFNTNSRMDQQKMQQLMHGQGMPSNEMVASNLQNSGQQAPQLSAAQRPQPQMAPQHPMMAGM